MKNKIGLLTLAVGSFGNKGFYNIQDIGLGKALSQLFDEVLIYRLVAKNHQEVDETVEGYENVRVHFLPSNHIESNGIPDMSRIDPTIKALICFSDTQIMLPKVEKWCKKNGIQLVPYIGVIKSHTNNRIKQTLINALFYRNLRIYKTHTCLAKTPAVAESLKDIGVENVVIAPVGLDMDLVRQDYEDADKNSLKNKYGYNENDKVILFVGRMTQEKQPERMLDIFRSVFKRDDSYRLLMIGSGELEEIVKKKIEADGLADVVQRINKVPNKDMWELYRLADCLVNLNRQEIFGMVLLEAMYYNCRVIAWNAPGPRFIIRDGETGYLVESNDEVMSRIMDYGHIDAHDYICRNFTWKRTADTVYEILRKNHE